MRAIDADALYKELNDIRKEEILLHGRSNNKNCCTLSTALYEIENAPTIEPEIVRCKDCKFYSPMNRETKTGICNLTMHQNFGDNWFCAGAERRTDEGSD